MLLNHVADDNVYMMCAENRYKEASLSLCSCGHCNTYAIIIEIRKRMRVNTLVAQEAVR